MKPYWVHLFYGNYASIKYILKIVTGSILRAYTLNLSAWARNPVLTLFSLGTLDSYLISLCLSFIACNIMIIVAASKSCCRAYLTILKLLGHIASINIITDICIGQKAQMFKNGPLYCSLLLIMVVWLFFLFSAQDDTYSGYLIIMFWVGELFI